MNNDIHSRNATKKKLYYASPIIALAPPFNIKQTPFMPDLWKRTHKGK